MGNGSRRKPTSPFRPMAAVAPAAAAGRQPEERLSPDDLAYHRQLIGQQQAQQAIAQSWMAHLSAKWQLQQGDGITEDGRIVRKAAVDAAAAANTGGAPPPATAE